MGASKSVLPPPRDFGWTLKETKATTFKVDILPTKQTVVILNHPLIRGGVTSELKNVEGYEGKTVPGYFMWHPFDHIGATMGPNNSKDTDETIDRWIPGKKLHINECMNSDLHGMKYHLNDEMTMYYLKDGSGGGQGMGKVVHGTQLVATRIWWEDVEGGVHYHYEISGGYPNPGFLGKIVNKKVGNRLMDPEFMTAWNRHNAIEVGAMENMLPALYAQREKTKGPGPWTITYDAATMNSAKGLPIQTESYAPELVEARLKEYQACSDSVFHVMNVSALETLKNLNNNRK